MNSGFVLQLFFLLQALTAVCAFVSRARSSRATFGTRAMTGLNMADSRIFLSPYFDVPAENLEKFKTIWKSSMDKVKANEPGCLYWGFTFNGNVAHCREAYADSDAMMAHLDNVGESLGQALEVSSLKRLEVHGPASELEKLKPKLADLPVEYFEYDFGFLN